MTVTHTSAVSAVPFEHPSVSDGSITLARRACQEFALFGVAPGGKMLGFVPLHAPLEPLLHLCQGWVRIPGSSYPGVVSAWWPGPSVPPFSLCAACTEGKEGEKQKRDR